MIKSCILLYDGYDFYLAVLEGPGSVCPQFGAQGKDKDDILTLALFWPSFSTMKQFVGKNPSHQKTRLRRGNWTAFQFCCRIKGGLSALS